MRFQDIYLSILLILVPIIGVIFYVGFFRKKKLLTIFIDKSMWSSLVPSISYTRRFWKKILLLMALIFVILTLMRPQYGTRYENIQRKGQDILIALDTSSSMSAKDVPSSRFGIAEKEIKGLIENLKGDRVGLMAFSGISRIQCPLTLDYRAVNLFLEDIQVGLVQRPGTNIAKAIDMARQLFKRKSKKYKIVISKIKTQLMNNIAITYICINTNSIFLCKNSSHPMPEEFL